LKIDESKKLKSGLDRTPGNQASPDEVKGYGHVVTQGIILYIKHLKENQRVCFGCG
jgi:hypothetical protein